MNTEQPSPVPTPPSSAASAERFTKHPIARPFSEIRADLERPVPERFLKEKKQGGATLTFLPWHEAVRLMDLYAPGWWGRIDKIGMLTGLDSDGSRCDLVYVVYEVTIITAEGTVSRQATGFENFKKQTYGDPFSNAESMAKRRALANFGLALHLYHDD